MQSNVWKLTVANAIGQSWPIRAVIYLYFLANAASPGEYQMVQWAMFWTLFFIEVPTGTLSDRWGRKRTLVLGTVCRLVGISLYAAGWNVWWFFVGEQILAVAKALHSGTMQSMLRESLAAVGRKDEYRRCIGRLEMLANVCQLLAVLGGGVLGMYSLRATAIVSACMTAIQLAIHLTLVEPPRAVEEDTSRKGVREALRTMASAFVLAWRNPVLRCVIACSGLVVAVSQHLYALRQPYAASVGLPDGYFGLLEAFALLVMVAGSRLAQAAHPKHDRIWLAAVGVALFGGSILVGVLPRVPWEYVMVPALVIACLVRGVAPFFRPIADDLAQQQKIDAQRATVLSIGTFAGYALVAVTGPFIQWALEAGWRPEDAILAVGIGGGVLYALAFLTGPAFAQAD